MCSLQMKFLFRSHSSCLRAKILELMSVFADEKKKHQRVIGLWPFNGPDILLFIRVDKGMSGLLMLCATV